jgi:hypothetical protein
MDQLLTTREVATRLRVAPETLRFWRWKAVGPVSFRVGGRVVCRESVVAERVDAQRWPDPASRQAGRPAAISTMRSSTIDVGH